MVADMEYGYDVERSAVDFTPATNSRHLPFGEGTGMRAVAIAADRGWQNTRPAAGSGRQLSADGLGSIQVAQSSPRPSAGEGHAAGEGGQPPRNRESGGASRAAYRSATISGRPLGILLAAVRPDHPPPAAPPRCCSPTVVGLGTTLCARRNRHAVSEDQRLARRVGRQRRRGEGGSAAGVSRGHAARSVFRSTFCRLARRSDGPAAAPPLYPRSSRCATCRGCVRTLPWRLSPG